MNRKHLLWILPIGGYLNAFWIYWLGNGRFEHDFSLGLAGCLGTLSAGIMLGLAALFQE